PSVSALLRHWRARRRGRHARGGRCSRPLPFDASPRGLRLRRHARLDIPTEDHLACGRLQHARHHDVDGLADHLARVVDHHHRAVVEIGHTLVVFLAFLQDEHLHDLAWQHDRLQRICQLINVQDFHALELGDLVEIEIVGDDLGLIDLRQFDQLEIYFSDIGEIVFHDLHVHRGHLLDPLQNIQPPTTAITLETIRRISHELKLPQHKLWHHYHAIQKSGLGDIGDAAIDNHTRVQDLEAA